jgi:flagella basal body P-ring formation protein FlgA
MRTATGVTMVLVLIVAVGLGLRAPGAAAGPGTARSLAETVREAAKTYVRERVTMPADSIAVSVDLPLLSLKPGEVADFTLDLFSTKPVMGTVPVKITFLLTGGAEITYAATARVRAFASVLVAAERIGRHQVVAAGALRTERREITHLADACYSDPAEVTGKRARRVISPGTTLRVSDVEAVPLVDRGQGVTVAVVLGRVTVTSKAKALEDGEMGEIIRVQDLTTGKRLVGTVAGKGLVVLDETML